MSSCPWERAQPRAVHANARVYKELAAHTSAVAERADESRHVINWGRNRPRRGVLQGRVASRSRVRK